MQKISEAIVAGSLEAIGENMLRAPTAEQKAKMDEISQAERRQQVREELGPTARVVAPYVPNRKQRRAQKAVKRAMHKEKTHE